MRQIMCDVIHNTAVAEPFKINISLHGKQINSTMNETTDTVELRLAFNYCNCQTIAV